MKREFGEEEMLTDYNIFEPEYFRSLLVKNMYHTKNYAASIEIRPIEPLNLRFFVDRATNLRNSYGNFVPAPWKPFQLAKAGLMIRYSPGIAFLNDSEELIQSSPPKSEWYFSVIQGLKVFESDYQFTKIDTKAKFNIRLSALGTTSIMVRGGKIFNTAPINGLVSRLRQQFRFLRAVTPLCLCNHEPQRIFRGSVRPPCISVTVLAPALFPPTILSGRKWFWSKTWA